MSTIVLKPPEGTARPLPVAETRGRMAVDITGNPAQPVFIAAAATPTQPFQKLDIDLVDLDHLYAAIGDVLHRAQIAERRTVMAVLVAEETVARAESVLAAGSGGAR